MSNHASTSTTSATQPTRTNSQWIRGMVYTALFGALFIAGSFIKINLGFTPVPISLQTFAIMLAGGLLGAVYGFWSTFIVVALTAIGLPLMNGSGGIAQITGPTGGFIWMYPVSAFLIGWASDRIFAGRKKLNRVQQLTLLLALFAFGSLLVYISGVPWLAHVVDSEKYDTVTGALRAGMYPFLPGDAIKAVVATLVIISLKPVLPAIRPFNKK
ncbi:biotin transporter BioY [Cohnella cholangitidis]|uniref:Biotin transporter n=1 Tax=Cohnella cholangitidis TaxID=2598458 RepID=A0A7G5BSZ5_9BACL|nr:biotin transporter BioY [Cohnella cholangitidis]QMV40079.1 biotin transporter BioY [Cohnella cholangitidis]